MADSLTVGLLKAILTLDSAQYESGMRQAQKTYKDMIAGMSSIGKQAAADLDASAKMIAGMSSVSKKTTDDVGKMSAAFKDFGATAMKVAAGFGLFTTVDAAARSIARFLTDAMEGASQIV